MIIPGCTILAAILTGTSSELLQYEVAVPIVDGMQAATNVCDVMVELTQKTNLPAASRVGYYRQQPKDEYD